MDFQHPAVATFRFGVFELDARSGELRRHGQKVRLPHQSFQILLLLLSRPGDVVTRDELRQALWTSETFVDFDVGLNSAIRKLRDALDDDAGQPTFIETLPRRGYRFVARVDSVRAIGAAPHQEHVAEAPLPPAPLPMPERRSRPVWIGGVLALVAAVASGALYVRSRQPAPAVGSITAVAADNPAVDPAQSDAGDGVAAGQPRLRAGRAVDPEAYNVYLKGVTASGLQRYDGYRTAVGYFEQAIARQPDFAEAHASLAQAQLQFLFGGPWPPREVIPKAEAAARRAIELDPTLAVPHRVLAQILSLFYWKWDEADAALAHAATLKTQPNGVPGSGGALIRHGRIAEAIAAAELARKRDPLSFAAQVNVATVYRAAGEHDRAIAELRRALDITPGSSRALFQLGVTYVLMGRFDDAIREFDAAVQSPQGRNPRFDAYRAYAYAQARRPLDARRILHELEARRGEEYVSSFGIALIYDVLGEKEAALVALERACEERAVEFAQARQYPAFKTIAPEARFEAVMQRVGLPR
jgi:DNA-binding winged helix-turn-helix (wHTH) protein/Flp pilus assembly protein TadD